MLTTTNKIDDSRPIWLYCQPNFKSGRVTQTTGEQRALWRSEPWHLVFFWSSELHQKSYLNASIHRGQSWTGSSHWKEYTTAMMDSEEVATIFREHCHFSYLSFMHSTHNRASSRRILPLTNEQRTTEPRLQDNKNRSSSIWNTEILKAPKMDTFEHWLDTTCEKFM